MTEPVFVGTNVLLYAHDARYPLKSLRADAVLAEREAAGRIVISTQVLQEFYSVATKKLRLKPELARERVEYFSQQFEVVIVQPHLILGAIDVQRLHGISFWDALLVRCASAANCRTLLTEDLSHGQIIEGVTIVNPFVDTQRAGEPRGRYTPTLRGPSKRVKPPRSPAAGKAKRRSAAAAKVSPS